MSGEAARPLGFWSLLSLGINGVVGVGIFFVPADLSAKAPGWASVGVLGATALLLAPVALTFSALGGRFDEDGGPVVYARAAFGEVASFVVGWVAYVSALASTAAVLSGLTRALGPQLGLGGAWGERGASLALLTVLAAVCAGGITLSARVWSALTVLKLAPLVALAVVALVVPVGSTPAEPAQAMLAPSAGPPSLTAGSLLAAALIATFSYQGFEIVPVVAGQARGAGRALPLAVLGSLAAPALLYLLLQAACVRALPGLARSGAPLVEAAAAYGGQRFSAVVALGTSVSALGICFGMVAMTPRYLSSLARGNTLGLSLDEISPRGVPLRALGVTWLLVGALVLLGSRAELFALSSVAVLAQYGVTATALWVLARRGKAGLPRRAGWLALPSMLVVVALVAGADRREWLVGAGAIAVGLVLRRLGARRLAAGGGRPEVLPRGIGGRRGRAGSPPAITGRKREAPPWKGASLGFGGEGPPPLPCGSGRAPWWGPQSSARCGGTAGTAPRLPQRRQSQPTEAPTRGP